MKVSVCTGYAPLSSIRFAAFLLWIFFSGCRCNHNKQTDRAPDWHAYYKPSKPEKKDPYKQLIVWLKPGGTNAQFSQWIYDSIIKKGGSEDINISFVCGSCDSTLFLLEGKAVEVYMQGEVAQGGSSSRKRIPVTGESGPVYFGTNLPVFFPDRTLATDRRRADFPKVTYSNAPVKVAVFDTGLDSALVNSYFSLYQSTDSACIPGGNAGWNFIENKSDFSDDNPQRHGTTVTSFITNEAGLYKNNSVEILPVKVFAGDGTGDLFTILCGFAYAQNRKVNIINASFGFYEPLHKYDNNGKALEAFTSPVMLKAFIEHYLTQNNILLLAAAGNKDDAIEDQEYDPADSLQKRNLDSVHFYPASLSPVLPNVIAVTTVYKDLVSPTQNFSDNVVDAGVTADYIDASGNFVFINPVNSSLPPVSGSSFATPVLTGKMAAWYHLYHPLLQGTPITKETRDSIFSLLKTNASPAFLTNVAALRSRIKEGKVIDHTGTGKQQAYREK